jgi:hypothetical protein
VTGLVAPDDWNVIAIRLQGPNVWLLVNDQPVLFYNDSTVDRGGVFFDMVRVGDGPLDSITDTDDATEISAVFRNLRVSSLADGDPARVPGYLPDGVSPVPVVGAVNLEDSLTAPGPLQPTSCPSGRAGGAFVREGYLMSVAGPCRDGDATASVGARFQGLTFSDGEALVDVKPVSAVERVRFSLQVRAQPSGGNWYYGAIEPTNGGAQLLKLANNQATTLDQRFDLTTALSPNDWSTMSIRARGPELWLLLNGRPVLYAMTDGAFDSGGVSLTLRRLGDVNDDQEAAVLVRNLRVSTLAEGDPTRAPSYRQP